MVAVSSVVMQVLPWLYKSPLVMLKLLVLYSISVHGTVSADSKLALCSAAGLFASPRQV